MQLPIKATESFITYRKEAVSPCLSISKSLMEIRSQLKGDNHLSWSGKTFASESLKMYLHLRNKKLRNFLQMFWLHLGHNQGPTVRHFRHSYEKTVRWVNGERWGKETGQLGLSSPFVVCWLDCSVVIMLHRFGKYIAVI